MVSCLPDSTKTTVSTYCVLLSIKATLVPGSNHELILYSVPNRSLNQTFDLLNNNYWKDGNMF
jgi:hypothetical protein